MIETRSQEKTQAQDWLITAWSRAVAQEFERLTNTKSDLQWARRQAGSSEDLATLEWWEARYEADGAHSVWIGIAGPAAVEIGSLAQALASSASGEPDAKSFSAEQTVQSLCESFAALLGRESGREVIFEGVKRLESAPSCEVLYATEIALTPGPAAPMLVGFSASTGAAFSGSEQSGDAGSNPQEGPLGLLLDLELPLSVRFGRVNMPLEQVLELRPGAVVELEGSQDDHVDLMVNGSVVAKGEVVAVDGQYAIRIMKVMSRDSRIESSKGLAGR